MKNLYARLRRRNGFTLVECLIALTVFAALTLVVFAILANARAASTKADETEENLTKLIDNVVGDDSYTRYNAANSDKILTLNVQGSSTPFRVSYSEIDGYKNFVLCPTSTCQYFADNVEFMTVEMNDFTQVSYICPKCNTTIVQELTCEDCGNTGNHIDTTSFTYIPSNGGYYCNDCGGTGVRGTNINESVISNYDLNVKTLVPNAIVYGEVERKTDPNVLFDTVASDGTSASSDITMWLTYTEGANASIPGTYKLRVRSNFSDTDFQIHVKLPSGYTIPYSYPSIGNCNVEKMATTGETYLVFYNCDTNADSEVEFQLVNETSGLSFEDDYSNPSDATLNGLGGYWFHTTSASTTYTDD